MNQHQKRMATQVTHDIRISVKAEYSHEQSDPKVGRFLFSYRIRIENRSARTVQLLRRHWRIVGRLFEPRGGEGPGRLGPPRGTVEDLLRSRDPCLDVRARHRGGQRLDRREVRR